MVQGSYWDNGKENGNYYVMDYIGISDQGSAFRV